MFQIRTALLFAGMKITVRQMWWWQGRLEGSVGWGGSCCGRSGVLEWWFQLGGFLHTHTYIRTYIHVYLFI